MYSVVTPISRSYFPDVGWGKFTPYIGSEDAHVFVGKSEAEK